MTIRTTTCYIMQYIIASYYSKIENLSIVGIVMDSSKKIKVFCPNSTITFRSSYKLYGYIFTLILLICYKNIKGQKNERNLRLKNLINKRQSFYTLIKFVDGIPILLNVFFFNKCKLQIKLLA